ncbi:hypothetical protein C4N20_04650 [Fusobacterium ulcerans]|nr:hypothetical protein C4N20_04650 [Fusobacterium ulcerans]
MTWALSKSVLNPSSSAVLLSPFTIKSVFTAVAFVSCLLSCPPVTTDKLGAPVPFMLIPPPLTLFVSLSFKCSTVIFSAFTHYY